MNIRTHRFAEAARTIAAGLTIALGACGASTVRIPVDDARTEYREVQKMDCSTYDTREKSLTVGIDFSLLWGAASAGPHVRSAETTGMKWDKGVHMVIAQYKELCSRFNTGAISEQSYTARLAEIDQLYAEAAGIRQSVDEVIRRHSGSAFSELERSTGEASDSQDADNVVASVDAWAAKLGVP